MNVPLEYSQFPLNGIIFRLSKLYRHRTTALIDLPSLIRTRTLDMKGKTFSQTKLKLLIENNRKNRRWRLFYKIFVVVSLFLLKVCNKKGRKKT